MGSQARAANYNFVRSATTIDGGPGVAAPRPQPVTPPAPAPLDGVAVEEFLQRLARAVQQFHTYPATSPLCLQAVEAAHRALSHLDHRDRIAFRLTPHEVIVDDVSYGHGGLVEHELARRLHAASIAEVTIDRTASPRELTRFCVDLVASDDRTRAPVPLGEMLSEHGVDRIALRASYRPEILDVDATGPVTGLVAQQQERRAQALRAGGVVNYLYPPDKGWIRIDPSSPLTSVSLVDLALLAEDPAALAAMLLRLTDGEAADGDEDALAQKFADVTTLFSALEPRIARVMFSRLSRAVLDLPSDRRQALLRRTILPGLLDGRAEGDVLRDFPDVDLAESLCLLLDLETAAPELVTTAFARLDLPAERQAAVMPLVENRLRVRKGINGESSVDAHARKLLRIDPGKAGSFAEFAAYDLAIDSRTGEILRQVREGIAAIDPVAAQLDCLGDLISLEPNPDVVLRFFDRATQLLEKTQSAGDWRPTLDWLKRCRALSSTAAAGRPDVAQALGARLDALCTPELALRLVALAARGGSERQRADALLVALGGGMGPAVLTVSEDRSRHGDVARKTAIGLLCEHAALVAPALSATIGDWNAEPRRTIVRVLGLAGAGYEPVLGEQLGNTDEQVVREALRGLARIGTPLAAALVRTEVEKNRGWIAAAAEETLWRFPVPEAHRQVTALLGRREFVLRQPRLAARLLDRAAQAGAAGLEPVVASLAPLRYRIWNPAVVRLARKARAFAQS